MGQDVVRTMIYVLNIFPAIFIYQFHIDTFQQEHFYGYKVANRKDDDISVVCAGMDVKFQKGTDVIESISCVYGGMAPTTVTALKTMEALVGW